MSKYNIQMNKYNALNTEYDQLYPVTKIENVDGLDTALQSKPNPNLLDNWYFVNPVDQRQGRVVVPNTTYYSNNTLTTAAGTTSAYVTAYRYATGTANGVNYASFKLEDSDTAPTYYAAPENVVRGYTGAGYGIDRLKINAPGAIIITDNGINLKAAGSIYGYSSFLWLLDGKKYAYGKTVTLSVLTTQGLVQTSGVISENLYTVDVFYSSSGSHIRAYFTGDIIYVEALSFSDSDPDIIAAKLELGSQQTLAHQENGNWVLNEIPDYGEQLARCQRYFQRIVVPVSTSFSPVKDNLINYQCNLPVQMRAEPSVTCGTFFIVNRNNDSAVFSENFVTPIKQSASVNSVIISIEKTQSNPVTVGRSGGAYVGSYYADPGTRIIDCTADL